MVTAEGRPLSLVFYGITVILVVLFLFLSFVQVLTRRSAGVFMCVPISFTVF